MADERAFVQSVRKAFASSRRDVEVGIGDDGAVVRVGTERMVAACDPVIEGVHFTRDAPPGLVGRKAVNRNVSDLAAMGARPRYLLLSILLSSDESSARRSAMIGGVRAAADHAGCVVIGGDTAATPGPTTLTVTALGICDHAVLRRDGAKAGDTIHVTGRLGGASLGHHLRFRPQVEEGLWLSRQPNIGAVIDISDGLAIDLERVLAAGSAGGARLHAPRIPCSAAARKLARSTGNDPIAHALSDGEDHVLLFTLRRGATLRRGGPLDAVARDPIGEVRRSPGIDVDYGDGRVESWDGSGYEHRW